MNTYICILRGINVGGQKKILMADLKALFEVLGFSGVVTYIQSGNVLFQSTARQRDLELSGQIEKAIEDRFGFSVPVILRSAGEMVKVLNGNPFVSEPDIDLEKLHVTFLEQAPQPQYLEKIKGFDYPPDRFVIIEDAVYLSCPIDYGHSKLSNNFFESKLKVKATTRNWKTVQKLVEMASNL